MHVTWQPGMTLADMEKLTILSALRFYRGNKTQTAESLGITVKTVYNKIEAYAMKSEVAEMELEMAVPTNPEFQTEPKSISDLDIPKPSPQMVTPIKQKHAAGGRK